MMLIQNKIGRLGSFETAGKIIDWLQLEWHETRKRILRKQTNGGKEVSIKFLNESPDLTEGDILFEDAQTIIAVEILPCDCLVIAPKNMFEMASVCYEIGNKHLPLFYEDAQLLVPFEQPLYKLLLAQGYAVQQQQKKLLQQLKTTVAPHGNEGSTLFSKIMKLTSQQT
ncbi:MAG TPA: urease accessory protein UreE [Ferruginibacter sp.]|nr:urease accessory protein UreE [Ferruginibacter sp.]HMP22339.1 urease accessory protein UreE [Ferruginibacter sp.]